MRKTDFSFLPERKQLLYEQMARTYRTQERQKNTPFSRFEMRLLESKIAVVSIVGAYLADQKPFSGKGSEDDYHHRPLTIGFKREEVRFFPLDWEPSEANEDFNVVLPIERLILLQKEGFIGKIHETVYSFAGYNSNQRNLQRSTDKIITEMKKAAVNGCLILPCSAQTAETACTIANQIEKKEIPTVVLTPFYEQALVLAPPRSAFINFPFGRTFGQANHVTLQTAILRDTLRLFERVKTPAEIINLSFVWTFGSIPKW